MNIYQKKRIVEEEGAVVSALTSIGWTKEELLEVVEAAVGARRSATANHPLGTGGMRAWQDGTCRLRELGKVRGLRNDDEDRIASTVDEKNKLRFIVSSGDENTGEPNQTPQNRNKKGAGTGKTLGEAFDFYDSVLNDQALTKTTEIEGQHTAWYLLIYCEGDTVKAEISCPDGMLDGFFTGFSERIILRNDEDSDSIVASKSAPVPADVIDINVSRKSS